MKFNIAALISAASLLASSAMADSYPWERLEKNNSVLVILDLQEGLYQLARDWDATLYKQSIMAHASLATIFDMPVIMSTSAETGPNGPLPHEILSLYPSTTTPLIKRQGEVNAWDNAAFRSAIQATNRTQIILAGIVTDVCTAFLARSLRAEGYSVWANLEASGTTTKEIREISNDAMVRAGVKRANELIPWLDRYLPAYGMVARAHKAAVEGGEVQPGEHVLDE
ncbi:Isochorismatase-like protein [Copromyces sp. CBS 386.78]|nr:Isochorismatase-like protein [Copromyces sp. CBS 386.78]